MEVTGVSTLTPPLLSESSSDSEVTTPVIANMIVSMSPPGSTFEVGGPSSASSLPPHLLGRTRQSEDAATRTRVDKLSRRMDAYDVDLDFIKRYATRTTDHVLALEEDNHRLRRRVDSLEVTEMLGGGAMEARPSESIDVLVVYGESQPPRSQGPPNGP
ncbi:hypothetical protein Tco_1571469 [Tanacetum coccineum]